MIHSLTRPGPGRLAQLTPLLCVLLNGACRSETDRPPPAPADDRINTTDLTQYDSTTADARDIFADGECESGATQTCRVYLPAHDGIQPCFVGEQTCVEAHWGLCEDAVLVDANADDQTLEPDDSSP